MIASVKFSTNLFIKDDIKPSIENESDFSFVIQDWLLNQFARNKFTFHLFPNGNLSLEIYPEVIFIAIGWDDYEVNPQIEHWYLHLEKEKYANEEAQLHSDESKAKKFFLDICQKINEFLKNESEIYAACWTPSNDVLEDFKLFAEICPEEN